MQDSWTKFMVGCTSLSNGQWTQRVPTEPGAYHVAHPNGQYGGVLQVYRDGDGELCAACPSGEWEGYWWSAPIPQPPTASLRSPA